MNRPGKFRADYLLLRECGADRVSELPATRYLPSRKRKISERLIQLLWKNLLFNNTALKTTNGLPIKVIRPGRFNRREGPDFRNGVFILEGTKMAGDVEIHLHAREWYEHKHHVSRHYDRALLHVFLYRSEGTPPAVNRKGKTLYELELGLYLRHSIDELRKEIELGGSPVSGAAGCPPCREALGFSDPDFLYRMLDIVAEGRMLIKSNRFIDRLESTAPEQLLYEIIFECLGYSRFKRQFRALAEKLPREKLSKIISANRSHEPHITAQALFFRLSGLDKSAHLTADDADLKELLAKYAKVDLLGAEPVFDLSDWPLTACRPANYPHRRIAAFSHIAVSLCDPEFFRKMILAFPADADGRISRKHVAEIPAIFTSVSDSFWDYRYHFNRRTRSPKKLVGKDRAVSILADCLIPFFLADCRSIHDLPMEKRLLNIYYATPKPSSNAVVDYMARNFFGKDNPRRVKSLRHQQALIQLYNDFCYSAPSACLECPLPDYIDRCGKTFAGDHGHG